MANVIGRQITVDGPRNAVVKFTGVLDSSDIVEAPALSLSDMVGNDQSAGPLRGFRIDLLEWSISAGLEVVIEWNAGTAQQAFPIAGRGRINGWNYGGFIPDLLRSGIDGAINLRTQNYPPGTIANFAITLELIKLYNK